MGTGSASRLTRRLPTRSARPRSPTCWSGTRGRRAGRGRTPSSGHSYADAVGLDLKRAEVSQGRSVRLPTELDDDVVASEQRIVDLFAESGQIASSATDSRTGWTAGTTTPCAPCCSPTIEDLMIAEAQFLAPRGEAQSLAPRVKFFWFLPTNGDSRSIVGASHASSHHTVPASYRAPTRRYLAEVARAADRLGYEGVLTPTGTWCEDAWLTASGLLAETERLKFLVAFRPGLVPPTLAAQQTATLQRFSEGRVLLNIVSGGDDIEQRRFGDWLGHDERYTRTGEFLHIVNSLWRQEKLDYEGSTTRSPLRRVRYPLAHHQPRHLRSGVGGGRGTS